MSAPVLFNGLYSEPIPPRFLCAVVKPPIGYPLAALSVCFVAPLCAVLWALGVILWKIHTEKIKQKMPDRY
uniref:Uncharacterized protein n=1 Tax=Romanomermis culicivorax TaxID=13658 RepID=A0A915IS15_ROMCU